MKCSNPRVGQAAARRLRPRPPLTQAQARKVEAAVFGVRPLFDAHSIADDELRLGQRFA